VTAVRPTPASASRSRGPRSSPAGAAARPPRPVRVVFVCLGNICRSPMAEVVFRHDLARAGIDGVVVDSAGTGGWHIGDPMDRRARAVLEDHGYEVDHVAKQFTPNLFADRDLVVAMDEDNLRTLRRLSTATGSGAPVRRFREFDPDAEHLDVPDPYYGGRDDFVAVLELLRSASAGLVPYVQQSLLRS
jgi:protein-tyrosine phosphatase